MEDHERVEFTDHIECANCGAAISVVRMHIRIIASYECPRCRANVFLLEPQAQE
jgi:uncharacterized paraquat-inducible protein A